MRFVFPTGGQAPFGSGQYQWAPAAGVALDRGWSLELYPETPIAYFVNSGTWFVPVELMLQKRVDRDPEFGIGGAFRVGSSANALYDYLLNARIVVRF